LIYTNLLITIANFVTILSKLTGSANYLFWKIHVKLALALTTHSSTVFTAEDIMNTLALFQATDIDEY